LTESIQELWDWHPLDLTDLSTEIPIWQRFKPQSSKLRQRIENYFVKKFGGYGAIPIEQKPTFDGAVNQIFNLF